MDSVLQSEGASPVPDVATTGRHEDSEPTLVNGDGAVTATRPEEYSSVDVVDDGRLDRKDRCVLDDSAEVQERLAQGPEVKAVEDSGVQILDELLEVELRRHPGEDERTSTDQWEVHLEGRLEDCSVVQPEGDRLEKCRDEDDPGCHGQQPQTGVIDDSEDAGPEADGPATMVSENFAVSATECDTKADDGLQSLNLDLGNIRQRFETPQEYVPSVGDRSALARSESLFKRLEKYQSVASGDRNGDAHSTESEEENDDNDDPSVVKEKRTKEKVVYEGLSSLKNQWESGSVNNGREKSEETREELAKLRKKMCLGRSESMRQVYQKAVEDANKVQAGRSELISVEGQEAKAISIKEKFETGVVAQETEAEKIERLNREKLEDLGVLSETAVIHEAKNIFKQLDAEVAKQSSAPTSLARSPSNRWSQPSPTKNAPVSPGEVVRSSDPVRDVEVETNELSERFKFFESYKVESKERKRFEMTPPREVKEPSPEFQVQRDPNVVRAADAPEEVIVTDTARRMRERFRELEESANREEVPQGPKPLKRITPPREYTTTTSRNQEHEDSPVVQRDPDIVQCSYRVDEDIVVEADRAKSMRARFENWDAERIAQENKKNAVGAGGENEEECLPQADTAKNLRAKFEAIKDESVRREVARPKPKVNRFV